MIHVSLAASFALATILFLLPGGGEVSLAQVSLSPACTIIDPVTGLCQTVTGIISPTATTTSLPPPPSPTVTNTTITSPTPTTSTGGSTGSTPASGGTTATGATKAASKVLGSNGVFGSAAYGPGGLFSGAYVGNFGGGTTYFAPGAQSVSSRQVYFQSAFGAPVSKEVATAAVDPTSIQSAPVASAITQMPRSTLVALPLAVAILFLVTCLVIEVNEGGAGTAYVHRSH
jgi:hypothetical protein